MMKIFSPENRKTSIIIGAVLAAAVLLTAASLYFLKKGPGAGIAEEEGLAPGEMAQDEKDQYGIIPGAKATISETEGGEGTVGKMPVITLDTSDLPPDADGDGLSDEEEKRLGTDSFSRDSDGDGIEDADEMKMGLDPSKKDNPYKEF